MVWLLLGCAATLRTELYLGMNRPDGPPVTEAEWQDFLVHDVTPRFPGFTVVEAQGYWEGTPEASHMLILLHPRSARDEIDAVCAAYLTRFDQEAVLRVEQPAKMTFVEGP